jgi:hypothetical protein
MSPFLSSVDPTLLIPGILLCLMGWTLYWISLNLTGGLTGGAAGVAAVYLAAGVLKVDPNTMVWLIPLGGVCGLALGIFFMRGLHRFLFFFAGSALGLAVGDRAFTWATLHVESAQLNPLLWRAGCAVLCSLAGGTILLWGSRWLVTLATAIAGSCLIVLSVNDPLFLLALAPLIPTSFLFQMGVLRRLLPDPARHDEVEEEYEEYPENRR